MIRGINLITCKLKARGYISLYLIQEDCMRSTQEQLGVLRTITGFA
jgi:hypothetical protein